MAEVRSKQVIVSSVYFSVLGNFLSSSPHALVNAGGSSGGLDASIDKIDILSQISWSTVVVIWDQVGTDVPDALTGTS